jgi:hypothetical protein
MEVMSGTWKERLFAPRTLGFAAAGLAVGLAAAGIGWKVWLVPQRRIAVLREETVRDVMALYDLQVKYKRAHGTYANGLDALLPFAPDPAALKARMAAHLDLSTLAVVGSADKFRIEANVLDGERTLVKIAAPSRTGPPPPTAAIPMAVPASGDSDGGAPIAPQAAP